MMIEALRTPMPAFGQAAHVAAAAKARPEEGGPAPVQLPYTSPVLSYDNDAAIAVLMFRDGETGDVETQIPSERVVREYRLRGPSSGPDSGPPDRAPDVGGSAPFPVRAGATGNSGPAQPGAAAGGAPALSGVAGATQGAGATPVNLIA